VNLGECVERKLYVSVANSKTMRVTKRGNGGNLDITFY
jgi:hypothetical protein